MRFPNPREVERDVYYGSSMKLKTVDATVRLSTWTASIGSKGCLQKAWVGISNIPLDRRTDANYFYAGSLVGVSLDLDSATLHKPEFVRVLIGCRDVERIPHMPEGCLGDNFYDFSYEVDKIVVAGPPRIDDATRVGGASRPPSPKRSRTDLTKSNTEETSEGFVQGSQTDSARHLVNCETIPENEPVEQESEEDSTIGDELLLETIHREHQASAQVASNKWLIPCPILNSNSITQETCKSMTLETFNSLLFPCDKSSIEEVWPPLPTITDVTGMPLLL
jgi:hypothetical protein